MRCGTPRVRRKRMEAARKTGLENKTVIELKALCKKKEIKGCYKMKNVELIKNILRVEKRKDSKEKKILGGNLKKKTTNNMLLLLHKL